MKITPEQSDIRIGHMGDAFAHLREIEERGGSLRDWAAAVARHLGEEANLEAMWPCADGEVQS